jgi:acyl carrier protein
MSFDSFLEKFREQLMEDDPSVVVAETKFRDLGSWDSLTAMAVITMIEDEYQVKINEATFKSFKTVDDIYNYISAQKQ